MSVYYNEKEPFAAALLRELMSEGLIPKGEVDERDIQDVCPDDIKGFRQAHFFAGIGGWPRALRLAGIPDDFPIWTGSCPCQPFSTAGQRAGFADERHLWPAFHYLLFHCKPDLVFGEQVEAAIREKWLDLIHADLEGIGYSLGAAIAPACSVGAPHIRSRLWWFGVRRGGQMDDSTSARRLREIQPPKVLTWEQARVRLFGAGSKGELADPQRRPTERQGLNMGVPSSIIEGGAQEREWIRYDTRDGQFVDQLANPSNLRRLGGGGTPRAPLQGKCALRGGEHEGSLEEWELPGGLEGLRRADRTMVDPSCEQMGLPRRSWESGGPSPSSPSAMAKSRLEREGRGVSRSGQSDQTYGGQPSNQSERSSGISELGLPDSAGPLPRGTSPSPDRHGNPPLPTSPFDPNRGRASGEGGNGDLGHSHNEGPQGLRIGRDYLVDSGLAHLSIHDGWSDPIWLPCRDGKYRPVERVSRTVESILTSMADGLPDQLGLVRLTDQTPQKEVPDEVPIGEAQERDRDGVRIMAPLIEKGANRVGRLKGYGNAIVPTLAAKFIQAVLDSLGLPLD